MAYEEDNHLLAVRTATAKALLLDCNGPWAVEVADQRDLPDDLMSDECELGNAW